MGVASEHEAEEDAVAEPGLLLVFTNPVEGREAELDRWYDEVHLSDVLSVPGVVAAQRYVVAEVEQPVVEGLPSPPPPAHRFLAAYELDRDPSAVMDAFVARVTDGSMQLHEALDMTSLSMSTWVPYGARRTS